MADLTVVLHGDAHGGTEALHGAAGAAHEAHDSFHELDEKVHELRESFALGTLAAEAFEKGLELVKDVLKESVEEYAKAEAAERQLKFVAGELSEEFERQAKAIGDTLAMKQDDVEHMQTMLLRYGAAPEVIGQAVLAVQNFAKATGQDADSAMMMLIRGVENGHGSLGRMGVQFQATGDFAKDFGSAVHAVNEKFGGAAETEAQGMTGRMRAAENAVSKLKESFGQLFATLESKTGVLEKTTNQLKNLVEGLNTPVQHASGGAGYAQSFLEFMGVGGGMFETANRGAQARGAGQKGIPTVEGENPFGKQDLPEVSVGDVSFLPPTQKEIDASLGREEKYLNEYNKWQDKMWTSAREREKADEKAETDHDDKILKEKLALSEELQKEQNTADDAYAKSMKDAGDVQMDILKQQTEEQRKEVESRTKLWEQAGVKIGEAVIRGLEAIFAAASGKGSGGKLASGQLSADGSVERALAQGIWSIFGMVADAAGMGQIWGALGSGMNSMDSSGQGLSFSGGGGMSSALAKMFSKSNSGYTDQQLAESGYTPPPSGSDESDWASYPSEHSGGWTRYHKGGWVDEQRAILLSGERVLSRSEVSRMGGPQSVDSAARGGTQSMTVYAFDSESMLDTFGRRGGRAMLNTVRTGRGPLRAMFGAGGG